MARRSVRLAPEEQAVLDQVRVRLASSNERARWEDLIFSRHGVPTYQNEPLASWQRPVALSARLFLALTQARRLQRGKFVRKCPRLRGGLDSSVGRAED